MKGGRGQKTPASRSSEEGVVLSHEGVMMGGGWLYQDSGSLRLAFEQGRVVVGAIRWVPGGYGQLSITIEQGGWWQCSPSRVQAMERWWSLTTVFAVYGCCISY